MHSKPKRFIAVQTIRAQSSRETVEATFVFCPRKGSSLNPEDKVKQSTF